jgi:cobyrinic acid a,c-diamide synthase
MKQILITGDRSGSGKTSITLALAALLAKKNRVQTFKVGMDYIDPSYLAAVSGRPCRNLDSFTLSDEQIRGIFAYGCRDADIALVEGVRGLYEGAEALDDTGSTAAVAKTLDLPVIVVVSAQSITRSAAAIVKGFQTFDPKIRISGTRQRRRSNIIAGSRSSGRSPGWKRCSLPCATWGLSPTGKVPAGATSMPGFRLSRR